MVTEKAGDTPGSTVPGFHRLLRSLLVCLGRKSLLTGAPTHSPYPAPTPSLRDKATSPPGLLLGCAGKQDLLPLLWPRSPGLPPSCSSWFHTWFLQILPPGSGEAEGHRHHPAQQRGLVVPKAEQFRLGHPGRAPGPVCRAGHRPREGSQARASSGLALAPSAAPSQTRLCHPAARKGTALPATRSELTWWLPEPCSLSSSLAQQGGPGNQSG